MSYNSNPEWTSDFITPQKSDMTCPVCGQVASNIDEVMSDLFQNSYYYPRHIPPTLIFTCGNEDCPNCDQDFTFNLSVKVTATRGD